MQGTVYHTPQINWKAGQLRPAPRKNDPRRRETFYPVICPRCCQTRWLRKHDALKVKVCSFCQRSQAGQLGYQAMVAKCGKNAALAEIARRQREKPSFPEFQVRRWLYESGVDYVCQYPHDRWLIDLVIGNRAIEVNGYWHKNFRADRDRALAASWPGPILFLDADDVIDAPERVQSLLREFCSEQI